MTYTYTKLCKQHLLIALNNFCSMLRLERVIDVSLSSTNLVNMLNACTQKVVTVTINPVYTPREMLMKHCYEVNHNF